MVAILMHYVLLRHILENKNTTQNALSGTGHNVSSFALMFRLPWLQ